MTYAGFSPSSQMTKSTAFRYCSSHRSFHSGGMASCNAESMADAELTDEQLLAELQVRSLSNKA